MTAPGVMDASAAVASTAASYRELLVTYQQQVTGQPATLRTASQPLRSDAQQLTAAADAVAQAADALGSDWSGTAYDAYRRAAAKLADDILDTASVLRFRADELLAQAAALETARGNLDAIIAWFDTAAAVQADAARRASISTVSMFLRAADQLGRQAVQLAKHVIDLLGKQLLGPEDRIILLEDGAWSGHHYSGEFGHTIKGGGGYYALGPRLYFPAEYERGLKSTTISGLGLSLLKAGASGVVSNGTDTVNASIDVNVEGRAGLENGDVYLFGETRAVGQFTGIEHGVPTHSNTVSGWVDAHANVKAGIHGFSEDVGYGRSIDFTHTVSAAGGGFKFDGTAGVGVGLRDSQALTATYILGHLKLGVGAAVIHGVGPIGSVNLDIDVPTVRGELAEVADSVYDSAASAARSVADSYADALRNLPSWARP